MCNEYKKNEIACWRFQTRFNHCATDQSDEKSRYWRSLSFHNPCILVCTTRERMMMRSQQEFTLLTFAIFRILLNANVCNFVYPLSFGGLMSEYYIRYWRLTKWRALSSHHWTNVLTINLYHTLEYFLRFLCFKILEYFIILILTVIWA